MKIILLPGLDGTGLLFKKLKESFPDNLDIEVISYDSLPGISYFEQAAEVARRFEGIDVYIVGESYSGRVAYELFKILGCRVKGIAFLASFVSSPSILSRVSGFLPVNLLTSNFVSKKLLYLFGFSLIGSSDLINEVFASINKADKFKLRSRLRNIAGLDKPDYVLTCPVRYIRPSRDMLVSASAVRFLSSKCSNFRQVEVRGGHFVAQSNPGECAKVIYNAVNTSLKPNRKDT